MLTKLQNNKKQLPYIYTHKHAYIHTHIQTNTHIYTTEANKAKKWIVKKLRILQISETATRCS